MGGARTWRGRGRRRGAPGRGRRASGGGAAPARRRRRPWISDAARGDDEMRGKAADLQSGPWIYCSFGRGQTEAVYEQGFLNRRGWVIVPLMVSTVTVW